MSKLSSYCVGLMEAAWLAVLGVIPVFFNRHSDKMFDPDKLALFRCLIGLLLAAWITRAADGFWAERKTALRRIREWLFVPLHLALTTLAVIYLASTWFSVDRLTSWRGSYDTLQGTSTFICYL